MAAAAAATSSSSALLASSSLAALAGNVAAGSVQVRKREFKGVCLEGEAEGMDDAGSVYAFLVRVA